MKPRLVVVGGFLGSGKTTLLLRIGERLSHEYGKRVVMITNDQGEVLVDSLTVKDHGFEAAEVIRGCFCCKFQVFLSRAEEVLKKLKPDVILAEPVGSILLEKLSYLEEQKNRGPLLTVADEYSPHRCNRHENVHGSSSV